MKEWLLEKTYEKPTGIVANSSVQSSGLIYEITHISKGLGFDHVTPFVSSKNFNNSVESSKISTDVLEMPKIKIEEITENDETLEKDTHKFYECVYLLVSNHPASTFSNN